MQYNRIEDVLGREIREAACPEATDPHRWALRKGPGFGGAVGWVNFGGEAGGPVGPHRIAFGWLVGCLGRGRGGGTGAAVQEPLGLSGLRGFRVNAPQICPGAGGTVASADGVGRPSRIRAPRPPPLWNRYGRPCSANYNTHAPAIYIGFLLGRRSWGADTPRSTIVAVCSA